MADGRQPVIGSIDPSDVFMADETAISIINNKEGQGCSLKMLIFKEEPKQSTSQRRCVFLEWRDRHKTKDKMNGRREF